MFVFQNAQEIMLKMKTCIHCTFQMWINKQNDYISEVEDRGVYVCSTV